MFPLASQKTSVKCILVSIPTLPQQQHLKAKMTKEEEISSSEIQIHADPILNGDC
jgi:hypothetical protein